MTNNLVRYDPAIADQANDRLEAQMFDAVNRHHREAQQAATLIGTVAMLQKAQAAQNAQHARVQARLQEQIQEKDAQLWAEKKNARFRVRCRRIMRATLALVSCGGVAQAMLLGLIHWKLGVPAALGCLLVSVWTAAGLWSELWAHIWRCR